MTMVDELVVPRDQHVFAFGPDMQPALTVAPGTTLRLQTNDCYFGQITSESVLPSQVDYTLVNAATGPIQCRGSPPR